MGTPDLRAVTNQVPPLEGHNVVTSDAALSEAVLRHGSAEVLDDLLPLGAEAGTAEAREHGVLANRHHPELAPYDRYGNRVDEVRFHPSWHWLMTRAVGHGLQAAPWERQEAGDPHAARPPGRGLLRLVADRAGPRLPDLHDLRRRPGAAGRAGGGQGVDPAARGDDVRPRPATRRRQGRCPRRHGDDGEAGRLGRAGQRHPRRGRRDRTTRTRCTATSGSRPRR